MIVEITCPFCGKGKITGDVTQEGDEVRLRGNTWCEFCPDKAIMVSYIIADMAICAEAERQGIIKNPHANSYLESPISRDQLLANISKMFSSPNHRNLIQ